MNSMTKSIYAVTQLMAKKYERLIIIGCYKNRTKKKQNDNNHWYQEDYFIFVNKHFMFDDDVDNDKSMFFNDESFLFCAKKSFYFRIQNHIGLIGLICQLDFLLVFHRN